MQTDKATLFWELPTNILIGTTSQFTVNYTQQDTIANDKDAMHKQEYTI